MHQARVHAGPAAPQARRVDARALDGFPGGFEEQPVLWVHRGGLARRDAEESSVELGCLVQESALADGCRSGVAGLGGVEPLEVPAAVGGKTADALAAVGDHVPQVFGRADAAGEATAHADDDDRVVVVCIRDRWRAPGRPVGPVLRDPRGPRSGSRRAPRGSGSRRRGLWAAGSG